MNILTAPQIRAADAYTMQHAPLTAYELMGNAVRAFANEILRLFPKAPAYRVFCGPGNNGADGLGLARFLHNEGLHTTAYLLHSLNPSPEYTRNLDRLRDHVPLHFLESASDFPALKPGEVLIDALFGTGLNRELTGLAAELIQYLNTASERLGSKHPAATTPHKIHKAALDMPSGLYADSHTPRYATVFKADCTIAFQTPRLAFFMPENEPFTGSWTTVDIGLLPEALAASDTPYTFTLPETVQALLKTRRKFGHKGSYGKALLAGGSLGKAGAVVLAAKACLRAGAGTVTVYAPGCALLPLQCAVPEAMVLPDVHKKYITQAPPLGTFTAFGIGPGMARNEKTALAFAAFLEKATTPLVLDADALNLLADRPELLLQVPEYSILTPHVKEFERLAGPSLTDFEVLDRLRCFAAEHKVYVVLKGAYTAIASPAGNVAFNSSGNPGMATAGSGDTLTGIITALLCQHYAPYEAALLGVYLHGLAGDIAAEKYGTESLTASDISDCLGAAFKNLHGE